MNRVQIAGEDDLIELGNHLSLAKCPQISAALTGRALRVFRSDRTEIGAAFNLFFQFQALSFVGDQNVSSTGCGHRWGFLF